MNFLKSNVFIRKAVLFSVFLHLSSVSFSQKADSTKVVNHISGAVTVTNNGISLIPTFSLGKPATVLDFAAGRKKLSFDPQLRFCPSRRETVVFCLLGALQIDTERQI